MKTGSSDIPHSLHQKRTPCGLSNSIGTGRQQISMVRFETRPGLKAEPRDKHAGQRILQSFALALKGRSATIKVNCRLALEFPSTKATAVFSFCLYKQRIAAQSKNSCCFFLGRVSSVGIRAFGTVVELRITVAIDAALNRARMREGSES